MKKVNPFVSCVVPIYNLSGYIERCVNSLLAQDYQAFQIILVDDGSTDDSLSVCKRLASDHDNIQVFSKVNGGQSSARNYAVDSIQNGFIVFVDIDDVVSPDFISTLVSAGNGRSDCISVVGLYQTGNPEKWLADYQPKEKTITVFDSDEATLRLLASNGINESPCGKLASVDIWRKVPFPEGRVYEDLSIMAKLFGEANLISIVDAKLYGQVYREGSTTRKRIDRKQFFDFVYAVRDVDNYITGRFGESVSELNSFRVLMCARLLRLSNDLADNCRDCNLVLNEARTYLRKNEVNVLLDRSVKPTLKIKMVLILHFAKIYQALYSLGERRKMRA